MAGYGAQAESGAHYDEYADYERNGSFSRSRGAVDRSDAMTYYGGLFSNHRAGSSVYGGLLDDAPPPAAERRHDRRRKHAADQGVRIGRYSRPALPHISSAEKSIMIFVAVFISVIFIGVIALEAYSVSIQHEINKKGAATATIQKDIDELYVSIEQGNNIAAIEEKAQKNLEMRYPSSEQLKYEKDVKVKDRNVNIADDIRSEAYGK
jgi:cell division protein FtsL